MTVKHGEVLFSQRAPEPVGPYPHARRAGNFLFLSGIGPRAKGETGVGARDFEKQCHSVFKNVRTVLEDAGAQWKNLVDVTVFLTNMEKDFKTYNRVYAEYFKDHQPCRTTVEVARLPTDIAIELKCIAMLEEET